eukprot:gnl/TRDRNA2_/TRDRNA2_176883_c4_seq3.p1 gnl/TRDRNA2_/TRDRNA2_176883_c4~~gnl/TRDRNA2_/TRDRNA2_176883_c4_seq3.p1  ORF type:complete len:223 (+),score=11.56 gnl/TRDRNA2_/TRDRNA2_176883_c4_seq3:3-671(+)
MLWRNGSKPGGAYYRKKCSVLGPAIPLTRESSHASASWQGASSAGDQMAFRQGDLVPSSQLNSTGGDIGRTPSEHSTATLLSTASSPRKSPLLGPSRIAKSNSQCSFASATGSDLSSNNSTRGVSAVQCGSPWMPNFNDLDISLPDIDDDENELIARPHPSNILIERCSVTRILAIERKEGENNPFLGIPHYSLDRPALGRDGGLMARLRALEAKGGQKNLV